MVLFQVCFEKKNKSYNGFCKEVKYAYLIKQKKHNIMKENKEYAKWILHHTWVIIASYIAGIIVLLLIHGAFGFTMNDDGTYLSNTLMHVGCGIVLAFGTGILQKEILKKYFPVSFYWVLSLITGFVVAELIAGLVLWQLEIYRGLINIFNTTYHLPEALIFALAGLISGSMQAAYLKRYYNKIFYWIAASASGWGLLILSTYLGIIAFLAGIILYGAITGFAISRILEQNRK